MHSGIKPENQTLVKRSLETFFLASYIGIDQYCKLTASLWEMENLTILLLLRPRLIDNVRKLVGRTKYTSLPLFDNVPYLRRFKVNGQIYITGLVDSQTNQLVSHYADRLRFLY